MAWFVIALICAVVILIIVLNASQRKFDERIARQRRVTTYPTRRLGKSRKIQQLLKSAYVGKQRLTIRYETGNPLPGEPAVKTRDIDIYGLGDDYFEAYCHYRGQVRIFKISRVLSAQLSNDTYRVPRAYTPSTWVTDGWGDLSDTRLESVEVVPTEEPRSYIQESIRDREKRSEGERVSRKALFYGPSREVTKAYTKYDWQKHFEESIKTPFPDEWSPALPYLYEANKLEKAGADPKKVQAVLEQARRADSNATNYYIARWSIIKKMQNK